jgi:hypothetical protein
MRVGSRVELKAVGEHVVSFGRIKGGRRMKSVKCYHCEKYFPVELAVYFPFGSSDDPFRPLCPDCSALAEGESSEQ